MLQQSPSSACSPTSYTRTFSHAHKQTHTHTNCLCLHWVVLLCVQAQPCHSILFSPSFDSLSPFLLSSSTLLLTLQEGGTFSLLSPYRLLSPSLPNVLPPSLTFSLPP